MDKIKTVLAAFFVISFIGFMSCSKSNKSRKELENQFPENNQSKVTKTVTGNTSPQKTMSPDSLIKYLPAGIAGTDKKPFGKGTNYVGSNPVTTASSEYVFPNHGFLEIQITDYGNESQVPKYQLRLFDQLPKVSGADVSRILIKNGKGYEVWNKNKNKGSFHGLVGGRFYLEIDAYNLPASAGDILGYVKYIKINELNKYLQTK